MVVAVVITAVMSWTRQTYDSSTRKQRGRMEKNSRIDDGRGREHWLEKSVCCGAAPNLAGEARLCMG